MTNTSYVSVKVEDLQTACELWLDERNERIKNKTAKIMNDLIGSDTNPWWKKFLKFQPSPMTESAANEYFWNVEHPWIGTLGQHVNTIQADDNKRIQSMLLACKTPNFGFVNLSLEDNSILEGYYENTQSV